jgi:hypothetical protein
MHVDWDKFLDKFYLTLKIIYGFTNKILREKNNVIHTYQQCIVQARAESKATLFRIKDHPHWTLYWQCKIDNLENITFQIQLAKYSPWCLQLFQTFPIVPNNSQSSCTILLLLSNKWLVRRVLCLMIILHTWPILIDYLINAKLSLISKPCQKTMQYSLETISYSHNTKHAYTILMCI